MSQPTVSPPRVTQLAAAEFNPIAECENCDEEFTTTTVYLATAQTWARRHILANPGHEVVITRTSIERWGATS